MDRIYLDNAATTWPKPESVYLAVDAIQRNTGAPVGRGAYRQVSEVQRLVDQSRQKIADLIHASNRQEVSFAFSGTDALSTAIFGCVKPGDHVVTSKAEHNSVLRPIRYLVEQGRITVTRVDCNSMGQLESDDVINAIDGNTKLVVLSHASNVTGAIQPVETIGNHCRKSGVPFLLDAAQTLGHLPIDVTEIGCDLLAAPGHKGLMGPFGTGVLYVAKHLQAKIDPLRFGGTGSAEPSDRQPDSFPEKMEAGNLNVPGIAGMNAGIDFLMSNSAQELLEVYEQNMVYFKDSLQQIAKLELHGPTQSAQRVPIFSVQLPELRCTDAAAILDSHWAIQGRAGFHCAPLLHQSIGTDQDGGSLRLSPGIFNPKEQIDLTLEALSQLANGSL